MTAICQIGGCIEDAVGAVHVNDHAFEPIRRRVCERHRACIVALLTAGTITYHDVPDLFWSENGEVDCQTHAPYRGSDTWKSGRWSKMTARQRIEWAQVTGGVAVCEVCPR